MIKLFIMLLVHTYILGSHLIFAIKLFGEKKFVKAGLFSFVVIVTFLEMLKMVVG